jgi:hypothetical protein
MPQRTELLLRVMIEFMLRLESRVLNKLFNQVLGHLLLIILDLRKNILLSDLKMLLQNTLGIRSLLNLFSIARIMDSNII